MIRKSLLLLALTVAGLSGDAQVTDPMITGWWFNTTNNHYNSILTDVEAVYYNQQYVFVKSSGIPNYYLNGQSVNNGKDLHATWQIPRVPQQSSNPGGVMGGQMGLMIDGSVFFHPGDAQSYQNQGVWNRLAYYFEGPDMDASNGHSTPDNWYHHHFDNLMLHNWDSTKHSPIVAYAFDGYPVYGPFSYANTDGTGGIKKMKSSYQPQTYTTRTNGPAVNTQYPIGCFIEDWLYTAGAGDLDEHNGRFCITPEYPTGTYAYFTTVDNQNKPYYPYFIGPTFYGTFSNVNIGPQGGQATVATGATQYMPITGVSEIAAIESNIQLYPIPVNTALHIKLKEDKTYEAVLYDQKGSVLIRKTIRSSDSIDMSGLAYGAYYIQLTNTADGTGFAKRIVKQ